jgi:hypothetical protein
MSDLHTHLAHHGTQGLYPIIAKTGVRCLNWEVIACFIPAAAANHLKVKCSLTGPGRKKSVSTALGLRGMVCNCTAVTS